MKLRDEELCDEELIEILAYSLIEMRGREVTAVEWEKVKKVLTKYFKKAMQVIAPFVLVSSSALGITFEDPKKLADKWEDVINNGNSKLEITVDTEEKRVGDLQDIVWTIEDQYGNIVELEFKGMDSKHIGKDTLNLNVVKEVKRTFKIKRFGSFLHETIMDVIEDNVKK